MQTVARQTERVVWVDNARAIAMLCIVLGHMLVERYTQSFVYMFHVPAFFFLSGYCFRDRLPFRQFVLHKLRRIMVPYAAFGLIAIAAYLGYGKLAHEGTISLPQCLLGLLIGSGESGKMQFNYHLWFLPALFTASVLFYGLKRAADAAARRCGCKPDTVYWILTALLFVAVYPLLDREIKWYLPWSADTALRLLPFFSLGFSMRSFGISSVSFRKQPGRAFAVSAALIAAGICFLFISARHIRMQSTDDWLFMVNYMRDDYGDKRYFLAAALLGIACVVMLSVLLPNLRAIRYFGQNTLPVLLMQKFPIMAFRLLLDKAPVPNAWLLRVILFALSAAAIVLCLAADRVIRRWLPFLYGDFHKKRKE